MVCGPLTLLLAGIVAFCAFDSAHAATDTTSVTDSLAVTSGSDSPRAEGVANSRPQSDESGLKLIGTIALFEVSAAAYSGIASDKPVAAGVLATLASPIFYMVARDNQPARIALVPAVAFGALAVFNFVLAAGDHSDERLFTYNMIACNVVAGAAYLVHEKLSKNQALGSAETSSAPAWAFGLGPVAGAPGLSIRRRF